MGTDLWSLFEALLVRSPLNHSDGSPGGSNDGPPGVILLGASLDGITTRYFRRLLAGYSDDPQWGYLLGASFEESGCGDDS